MDSMYIHCLKDSKNLSSANFADSKVGKGKN